MSVSRGRPSAEGGGRSGSITNHSPSVVSLSYRTPSRLYCGRVILVQTIVLSFESIHPKESQLAEITQFLFQSDTKTFTADLHRLADWLRSCERSDLWRQAGVAGCSRRRGVMRIASDRAI